MKIIRYKLIILFLVLIIHCAFLLEAEVIWENYYNTFGADGINVRPHMQICSDGSYAVTGYYVVEDGTGGYLEWQGYVMKISSEGELLWADPDTLAFMGSNESDAIKETSDGGLINCGDGYMIKRDANGSRLWTQDLNIAPTTMCHSHDGNIVLSGSGPGGACLFRIIDEDGNEILNNDFSIGLYSTTSKRIIQTSDGGYALTGRITDEVPDSDIFICKTDAVGDTLWTYRKDGCGDLDTGNWILENSENKLLIVGGILPEPITIRGYLALFDLNGNNIWEEIVGNNDIWYEHFYAIDLPEDNSFLLSTAYRVYKSDYDYNIEWIAEDLLAWFQKTNYGFIFYIGGIDGVHLRETDNNIVSIHDNVISITHQTLNCYPNPFNPKILFSFELKDLNNSKINIYNSKGQRIKKIDINKKIDSVSWSGVDNSGKKVSSGVYFITLNSNGKTLVFKKITLIK